ncbi:hypothetical protein DFS34DRAFT_650111 [Phlyctochytrium arcticum]|nr:hypothetical protein DFS34DRAFT_650111 [Phlyctochytrium arcticum]
MNDHAAARAGTRSPAQEAAAELQNYRPTPQEKAVIDAAGRRFLLSWMTGIALGCGGGFLLLKNRNIPLRSMPGAFVLFATSTAGEFVGRRMGVTRARATLNSGLPQDSKVRSMVAKMENSMGMPSIMGGSGGMEAEVGEHEYGLEGSVPGGVSPVASASSSGWEGGEEKQESSFERAAKIKRDADTWGQIRKENSGPSSTWDRLRKGAPLETESSSTTTPATSPFSTDSAVNPDRPLPPSQQSTSSRATPIIPRTRAEQLESERLGHLRRNSYGDLDEPVVASVGGRGQIGPYGDAVAATPAGTADIPRTREGLEAAMRGPGVKRNQWGDLTD